MKFYLSGPSLFAESCLGMMKYLEDLGLENSHDWASIVLQERQMEWGSEAEKQAFLRSAADADLQGILDADFMVIDCGHPTPGRGMWVELGWANAHSVPVIFYQSGFDLWDLYEGELHASNLDELKEKIELIGMDIEMSEEDEEENKLFSRNGNACFEDY